MIPEQYLIPYICSNLIALGMIVAALRWPRVARILFVAIFALAGTVNSYMAITNPADYLEYREFVSLEIYRAFIDGFFSQHTRAIVLAIACGQLVIAALLLAGDQRLRKIGMLGAVIFFIAIIPLGVGSAFPCSLLLAVAITLLSLERRTATTAHR